MPITIEWPEIALRLALTVVAGALIGLNRSEHGHSAGLRTTLLVCLAASVSMIQVNLLLPIGGKSPDSFAVLDLMRPRWAIYPEWALSAREPSCVKAA
jgi:putative Mg2+ transporter-C (MgtC) family protein